MGSSIPLHNSRVAATVWAVPNLSRLHQPFIGWLLNVLSNHSTGAESRGTSGFRDPARAQFAGKMTKVILVTGASR